MSWYRKYRPTTVSGLHLSQVRQALQQLMERGHLPHAFLFAGPKGTGKTSAARIISAVVNDPANADAISHQFLRRLSDDKQTKSTPYQEPNPQDELVQRIQRGASFIVHELDAASHRGIDDIRQLKENIHLPPQEGSVSVYILDEVHMLTTEAFNALLKVLEEPPAHVLFILATTELHKVPDTIVSRCTVIQFTKATAEELHTALASILDQEGITYDVAALERIVKAADGSFRDGVKLLETVALGKKKLSLADLPEHLTARSAEDVHRLLKAILAKDEKAVLACVDDLRQRGQDPQHFLGTLLEELHGILVAGIVTPGEAPTYSPKIAHFLLSQFQTVSAASNAVIPFLGIELKALELVFRSKEKEGNGAKKTMVTEKHDPVMTSSSTASAPREENCQREEKSHGHVTLNEDLLHASITPEVVPTTTTVFQDSTVLEQKWEEFLQFVRQKNSALAAVLRSAKLVSTKAEKAKIEVYYEFHREQLLQPKFRAMLDECIQSVIGGPLVLEFSLAEQSKKGAELSNITAQVDESELVQLAKDLLV